MFDGDRYDCLTGRDRGAARRQGSSHGDGRQCSEALDKVLSMRLAVQRAQGRPSSLGAMVPVHGESQVAFFVGTLFWY